MDVTSLNLIEKAEYIRPKSFAKEGIRDITCFASPLGRLYIDCELTDYSCIWYSVTKSTETVITGAIFEVLQKTASEPNREWYTSPLNKVLEATNTSWNTLHSYYPIKLRVTAEGFSFEHEQHSKLYSAENAAEAVTREILLATERANDAGLAGLVLELKSYTRDFDTLLSIKDNGSFLRSCSKIVTDKQKRIEALSYLIFSKDPEASAAYSAAKKSSEGVYNRLMTLTR